MTASWRQNTRKQHHGYAYLLRWLSFCQDENMHIEQASIHEGLAFLTSLYKQGLGYSAINTARSTLSSVNLVTRLTFGEHPLVTRYLKLRFVRTRTLVTSIFLCLGRGYSAKTHAINAHKENDYIACTHNCTTFMHLYKIIFSIREKLKTTRPGKHL